MLDPLVWPAALILALAACVAPAELQLTQEHGEVLARPGLYAQLTEPPCAYGIDQDAKGFVRDDERVIAWLRAAHQGGAIPLRHFLAAPRVINDTYGLFFFDADGGYVSAFQKDYGFEFYGWRRGVMVVRGLDGSLYSALTGLCFDGPSLGRSLTRIPSMLSQWDYWLRLHPESTAYDLFDGQRYLFAELPAELSSEARQTMGKPDARLAPLDEVLGVRVGEKTMAFPLAGLEARATLQATVGDWSVAVFWYEPTRTAVAWRRALEGAKLDFYGDPVSPATAPIKDRETGTRWSLAGRGIDGLLRGKELVWVDSVQCRWYAWVAEHPDTEVFTAQTVAHEKQP
ncbi:MAG: DUF3179 domain-containing protein [Planctomycetes bacterium]|nr:DUF3179 domain-containing protein [Planctomycetota bacterium]